MPDRTLYFITKSGETRTLKDSEYNISDNNCLCILDNIYIPFYQIPYFRITEPFEFHANYPVMDREINIRVAGLNFFSFHKVSYPYMGPHISFMQRDDKNVLTHYFPYSNVISLTVNSQEEKEADAPV